MSSVASTNAIILQKKNLGLHLFGVLSFFLSLSQMQVDASLGKRCSFLSPPLATQPQWQLPSGIWSRVGGRQEEAFRVGCGSIAGRLGCCWQAGSPRGCQQGTVTGISLHCGGNGWVGQSHCQPRCQPRSGTGLCVVCWPNLESLALEGGFAVKSGHGWFFQILFPCSFSKATGIYLVKKQLINLFDLHVEMNHIKFQVKSLSFVECLLNLSRFLSSAHGLSKVYCLQYSDLRGGMALALIILLSVNWILFTNKERHIYKWIVRSCRYTVWLTHKQYHIWNHFWKILPSGPIYCRWNMFAPVFNSQ